MKCADPVLCYTNGSSRKFRHFSLANPTFKLMHQQVFNCGKCVFCRKKKAFELAVRCVLHASLYDQNCFLTLTYDEKKDGYHNKLQYSDIQKFKKKLRRHCEYHFNKKIQIFNVHEYGKNGKKHWHLVVFNYSPHQEPDKGNQPDCKFHTRSNGHSLYVSKTLSKLWTHGFNTVGDISEASAMYTAQYTQKDIKNSNTHNSKKAKSQHSGIGRDYFLKHYEQILSLGYVPFGGKKVPLPRYFVKIAHKHYSHFFEQENFFDLPHRKKLYTPFKQGEENKRIADLFIKFRDQKNELIQELTSQWEEHISQYIFTKQKPDFLQAAENYLHDLKNKKKEKEF